jgi:DNA-binding LacI/PurR family transcriptional regulator
MAVTQKEIAERLNISQAHVARALSSQGRVSESTRLRVEAAARELGYSLGSNNEARNLAARRYGKPVRKGIVAVVFSSMTFDNSASPSLREVPFFVPVLDGMEDEAEALGLDICLCPLRSQELPRLIRERSVDGMVMLRPLFSDADLESLDLPSISFHWSSPYSHSISPDDREGARQATRYLLDLGHRRIAFLGMRFRPGFPWEQRLNGYLDAMRDYGVEVRDEWIETNPEWPILKPNSLCAGCGKCAVCIGWQTLMTKCGHSTKSRRPGQKAELPFTALVCYNDIVAMAAIQQAKKEGVRVPEDLSVVGFDDVSEQYNFTPQLTSIHLPRYEMGRSAIRLLHEAIEKGENMQQENRLLPVTLNVHQSTGAPTK